MPEPSDETPPPTDRIADLEQRVRKLETAVTEVPTPILNEDAIADRVIAKLSALAGEPRALVGPSSDRVVVLDTSAVPSLSPPAEPEPPAPAPPQGAVLRPPAPPQEPTHRAWFLPQLLGELRLIFQMYFDPRYRISRTTQFALPGVLLLLVFNYFFFNLWVSIAFVSPITERVLAVALGILGYKLLTRETLRYRGVLEYLSRYSR